MNPLKGDKDFDLLLLPNQAHGYAADGPYMMRRRWDYFMTWLMGAEPPRNTRCVSERPVGRLAVQPSATAPWWCGGRPPAHLPGVKMRMRCRGKHPTARQRESLGFELLLRFLDAHLVLVADRHRRILLAALYEHQTARRRERRAHAPRISWGRESSW